MDKYILTKMNLVDWDYLLNSQRTWQINTKQRILKISMPDKYKNL